MPRTVPGSPVGGRRRAQNTIRGDVVRSNVVQSDVLTAISAVAIGVALFLVFLVAPREAVMGDVQRVFYFHVASAWVGYLALLVAFVTSLLLLLRGEPRWDWMALSSAEIGLIFITQGIVSGMVWAKATWGKPWVWEPRLTTSALLWVIYVCYMLLRHTMGESTGSQDAGRRARIAAVWAVLGFVAVPINFMAIRWWRAVHPLVLGSGGGLAPVMLAVMIYCVFAFTLLFVTLLVYRFRLQAMGEEVQQLKRRIKESAD